MDDVLDAFLAAPEKDAEETLGALLTHHAAPIVRRVISSRLGWSNADAEDICSQVLLQLMLRLRQGRIDDDLQAIDAFGAYAAAAAHHGCDHYLRRKYPLRWQLRNRIRYVLEHDAQWAVWQTGEGTWLCGRAAWRSRRQVPPPRADDLAGIASPRIRELLQRMFELSGGPLELTRVVDLSAELWRVPLIQQEDVGRLDAVADPATRTDAAIAQRQKAERVWAEIRELPVRQRQALLLNLKDDAICLFLITGTASLRAIADALDMGIDALAGLWNDLPLPDNDVAARLGCTRQQVINLRMAARKRLSNRLAGWS
jgi:RNA polymerase sigma factor (sigma-70 family)